jgi:hypothetical protein
VESTGRTGDGGATFATLDGHEVANGWRRLGIGGNVEACAEMRKNLIVELAAAKKALEFEGRVLDDGRSRGFRNILGGDDGFVSGELPSGGGGSNRGRTGRGLDAAATESVLEVGLADFTRVTRDGAWLAVIECVVGWTGPIGEHTVIIIVNVQGEAGESEPAAGMVANKGATRAATAMDADGKERAIQRGDVVDSAEFQMAASEKATDGANTKDRDAAAISKRDVKV